MEEKSFFAGKSGADIRSDCYIELIPNQKELSFEIKSKVSKLFGESILSLLTDLAAFFEMKNTLIRLIDYGALPFTIMARFESAVKRMNPSITKEYLPELLDSNKQPTEKERLRRSRLYIPGNEPKYFINAGLHKPDGIIFDLEDSVAPSEKDSAAILVRNALRTVDFYGCERMVRINQLPKGTEDLKMILKHNVNAVIIPKVETAEQIHQVVSVINEISPDNTVLIMPIIETALGVENAFEIASSSELVNSLSIGLEDYTADIGVTRTNKGTESLYARLKLVNSAKAANILAIDTVFSDVQDMQGLMDSVIEAKSLGFSGKACIHPRQIQPIHDGFSPTAEQVEKAKKIVLAFEDAKRKGLGVVSLGKKMIDAPVVKQAENTVKLAILNNRLSENWIEDELSVSENL